MNDKKTNLTEEYFGMRGLELMNASNAYDKKLSGKDFLIGIIDSGIQDKHPEFDGKVEKGIDLTKINFENLNIHGSHVAGIVAAKKDFEKKERNMHGVAYCAKLMDFRIFDSAGKFYLNENNVNELTSKIIENKIKIVNRSYGLNSWYSDGYFMFQGNIPINTYKFLFPNTFEDYNVLAQNNSIQVWAGGNSGYKELGIESALALLNQDIKKVWCSTVAVDKDGRESFYTNRAGKFSALNSITSYGGGINGGVNSTDNKSGYASFIGTSMAAPGTTGSIALVLEKFKDTLSNEQCLIRLFMTASYEKLSVGFHESMSGKKEIIIELLEKYQLNPTKETFIEIKKLILGNNFEKRYPNSIGGKCFPPKKFDYYISANLLMEKLRKPYKRWNNYRETPALYILFYIFGWGLIDLEKATADITVEEINKIKNFDLQRTNESTRIKNRFIKLNKRSINKEIIKKLKWTMV